MFSDSFSDVFGLYNMKLLNVLYYTSPEHEFTAGSLMEYLQSSSYGEDIQWHTDCQVYNTNASLHTMTKTQINKVINRTYICGMLQIHILKYSSQLIDYPKCFLFSAAIYI